MILCFRVYKYYMFFMLENILFYLYTVLALNYMASFLTSMQKVIHCMSFAAIPPSLGVAIQ